MKVKFRIRVRFKNRVMVKVAFRVTFKIRVMDRFKDTFRIRVAFRVRFKMKVKFRVRVRFKSRVRVRVAFRVKFYSQWERKIISRHLWGIDKAIPTCRIKYFCKGLSKNLTLIKHIVLHCLYLTLVTDSAILEALDKTLLVIISFVAGEVHQYDECRKEYQYPLGVGTGTIPDNVFWASSSNRKRPAYNARLGDPTGEC